MADVTQTHVLASTSKRYVAVFTNLMDGGGEESATKVDISALSGAPTSVGIRRVVYDCNGVIVRVRFDGATDVDALILSGQGEFKTCDLPIKSIGTPGDIVFVTVGASANNSYTILLDLALS